MHRGDILHGLAKLEGVFANAHSRCSKRVSMKEVIYDEEQNNNATKVNVAGTNNNNKNNGEKVKRRDGDGFVSSCYLALLQLIVCGGGSMGAQQQGST